MTKTFARWSKKILTERDLCMAAHEIDTGVFEADLGSGVCKKRIAIRGQGKRGATRILVATKNERAIIFMAGREKNESGADFSATEEVAAKGLAKAFERATVDKLNELASTGVLLEICNDD